MKAIIPILDPNKKKPMYIQLYDELKSTIINGNVRAGDKLPSLRSLAEALQISLTTVEQAYCQLSVEGYISSKPSSGYFVNNISSNSIHENDSIDSSVFQSCAECDNIMPSPLDPFVVSWEYDLDCFDFAKWKKYTNKVLTMYPHLLMQESDPQGELFLRDEIASYLYSSRGVVCSASQIVIAAGTQQITNHIATLLKNSGIRNISLEDPGYLPVENIFRDRDFSIIKIPVLDDGIDISKLPANIPSALYVSPSNQFPTGAVMPVGKRYELLRWAYDNQCYIIEDDYDSELRYLGKPVPSLQGLDNEGRVIYLGSFSSTLFPSIKISYMVLPEGLIEVFQEIAGKYSQTCSKIEQLTLGLYMADRKYHIGIKKVRRLYWQKLRKALSIFSSYDNPFIRPINTHSGMNMILLVNSPLDSSVLSQKAASIGLKVLPLDRFSAFGSDSSYEKKMIFYYNQIPINEIPAAINALTNIWSETHTQNYTENITP